jgi:DNA-binding IscR family transcriptional regulator
MKTTTPLIRALYETQLGSCAAKLVAINLALAAHEQGDTFFKQVCDIAREAQMSERFARDQIQKLVGLGVLQRVHGAPGTYRFNIDQVDAMRAAFPEKVRA